MRQREEAKGRASGKHRSVEVHYIPSVEDATHDVVTFLGATEPLGDVPIQEDAILLDIQRILDDELLSALDKVLDHYFYEQPDGLQQEDLNAVWPLNQLRKKLVILGKSRLRDAITVKLKPARS